MFFFTRLRLGVLSQKHLTSKTFDENADGYLRSDGVVVMILQKAHSAKRIYAEVDVKV